MKDTHACDHHGHAHHHHGAVQNIAAAFALNLIFTAVEIVGGLLTGSVAILADAVHDLGDTLSLGAALYLQKVSTRERDSTFSYGYKRYSILSALLSGIVIVAGSLLILREAIPRLWSTESHALHGWGMFGLACVGVVVNGIAALRLGRGLTENEKILRWHFFEDAFGWIAVLIGSIFVVWKGWAWMDPLLAVLLALFVMWNVIRNLKGTVRVLLQARPPGFDAEKFSLQLREVGGVASVHDLHAWSLDGIHNVLSMHVVLEKRSEDVVRIKKEIQNILRGHGEFHVTIETEFAGEICHENCDQ